MTATPPLWIAARLLAHLLRADGAWVRLRDLRALLPARLEVRTASTILASLAGSGVALEHRSREGTWRLTDLPPDDLLEEVLQHAHTLATRRPRAAPPMRHRDPAFQARRQASWQRRHAGATGVSRDRLPCHEPWSREEDETLVRLAGRMTRAELTAELERLHGIPRTIRALAARAVVLGVYLRTTRTGSRIADATLGQILGTRLTEGVERLVTAGLLTPIGERRGFHHPRWFRRADVEAFLRTAPWAYDRTRISDPSLRSAAEVAHRRDPWLTVAQATVASGVAGREVRRLAGGGLIVARQQMVGLAAARVWRIPASEVATIRALARPPRRALAAEKGRQTKQDAILGVFRPARQSETPARLEAI